MTIERAWGDTGLPAYLIVIKNAKKGTEGGRYLLYPTAHNFDRLWALGEEQEQAKVDGE